MGKAQQEQALKTLSISGFKDLKKLHVIKIPPTRYVSIFSQNSNGLHRYNVSQPELQPQINSQNNLN